MSIWDYVCPLLVGSVFAIPIYVWQERRREKRRGK